MYVFATCIFDSHRTQILLYRSDNENTFFKANYHVASPLIA